MKRPNLFAFIITGVLTLMSTTATAEPGALPTDAEGFAFLAGEWRIQNRKLKEPLTGRTAWDEFDSSARFFTLLNGLVSVEELRGADGKPFGSALRTFDRERRVWRDSWISGRSGVPGEAVEGRFVGDTAHFTSPDTYNGKPILVRGTWRRVSAKEVIWEQAASTDKGKTWEMNWHMRFHRD